MNRKILAILLLSVILILSGCKDKKETIQLVTIGNLAFTYDSGYWTAKESAGTSAPLEFANDKGDTLIVNVSKESTYQIPLDMIDFVQSMVSGLQDYQVTISPTVVNVKGVDWYEYGYSYTENGVSKKVYQRYFGKYYNSASISFTSTAVNYDAGYAEAIKVMNGVETAEASNAEQEAKGRAAITGEWEVVDSGYLVFHDDSTYEWYKDSSMDPTNMHHGTYACDVESQAMNMNEGEGLYVALFPAELVIDGVAQASTTRKLDYLISLETKETVGFQMVNLSTYSLYTVIKVK